jgi:beta-mannosidase
MTASTAARTQQLDIRIPLAEGWELASTDSAATPGTISALRFTPARVPGTVASALRDQGTWRFGSGIRFDTSQHWFRCRFNAPAPEPGEEIRLHLGGIATLAEVWFNGEPVLKTASMFQPHQLDITALLRSENELLIACHPLADAFAGKRRATPAARWRTRVVADQQLRWFRTTLLGRAPGFAPEPEPVGPWRPVTLIRRRGAVLENGTRRTELNGSTGLLHFHTDVRELDTRVVRGRVFAGDHSAELNAGPVRVPNVRPWNPHTHGDAHLYPVRVELDLADGSTAVFHQPSAGFRSIEFNDGFIVNGRRVFSRGVVWTPPDPVSLAASEPVLRERLERLRDAGINLIHLAGTTYYEDETFHTLCDELGLLVWQDLMFANMDYPFDDPEFHATVRAEAETELARLSRHPSTALICGNSEIEQQASMLGLSPSVCRAPFFAEELPSIVDRLLPGTPYLPSAPCGGDLPFHPNGTVANYFGVGAYLRPIDDVRRTHVRFASECLAFANVPEPEMIEKMMLSTRGGISPTHPAWKRAVPRDGGAGWDFEDIRDFYLKLLYNLDPVALRYSDMYRYWELSRLASAECMAEVFNEWRRPASPCGGGIILWAADLQPGAGWGILDSLGHPKGAWWFLKRALAPRAVWTTDEGLNGIDIHVANDAPVPLDASLRVALFRREHSVAQADQPIHIPAQESRTFGAEQILGRFADASWSYRFGPPGHDAIVATLHNGDVPFAQAFRFPAGRPVDRSTIDELGISAQSTLSGDGSLELTIRSRCLAWGVRPSAPGWIPDDCYFGIEPGGSRRIMMTRASGAAAKPAITITAINAEGRIQVAAPGDE